MLILKKNGGNSMGYSVPMRSSSEANRSRNNNDTVRAIEYLGELKEADNRVKEAQREALS
jgi:hypothetical protein